jgi:hypothetical protein
LFVRRRSPRANHFPTAGADLALSDGAAIAPRVDGVFALVNMDTTTRPSLFAKPTIQ